MNTYLVTGAAGFIGGSIAKRLINEGNSVVTIDNLKTGFKENIPDGVTFLEGDCADQGLIDQLNDYSFDVIFHIAGQSSGEISFDNPGYDLNANTLSTLLLLRYAVKHGCRKFIYASTMSVYGEQPDAPVSEDVNTLPKSFYAVGKIASEHYLRIYSDFGMANTALRLFNVYGPGQNMQNMKQGMVSIYLAQAIKHRKIIVKGSPNRYRDFIYIDDVVSAFISAGNINDHGYRYYNVGTGIRTTIAELLTIIRTNLPCDIEIEFSGFTPGDQFGIYADIAKIQQEIRWIPTINLNTGLPKMIKWALEDAR